MLVLSRFQNERIVIRDHAGRIVGRITLVEIRGLKKARIGFEFDPIYTVHREEVDDQEQARKARKDGGHE